jgi:hypothetical protein
MINGMLCCMVSNLYGRRDEHEMKFAKCSVFDVHLPCEMLEVTLTDLTDRSRVVTLIDTGAAWCLRY